MFGVGETIELSCSAESPSMSILWLKDGIAIRENNRTHTRQNLLKITNVSYDDSGIYSCTLLHSTEILRNFTIRVAGEFFTFFVSKNTSVVLSWLQLVVKVGQKLKLSIKLLGPAPIKWYYKGQPHLGSNLKKLKALISRSFQCSEDSLKISRDFNKVS